MSVLPFGPRVLVASPPAEPESGIVLPPGTNLDRLDRGIVLEVPEHQPPEYPELQRGDDVWYARETAIEIEDVKLISYPDVLAFERN